MTTITRWVSALALAMVTGCPATSDPAGDGGRVVDVGADALAADSGTGSDAGPPGCTNDDECDDGSACATDCTADMCVLSSGSCRHTVTPALCPVGESCNAATGCCEAGRPCATSTDCEDDDPCTVAETCEPAARVCTFRPLDGDVDGDPPRVCGGGDCDDSNPMVFSGADERCNGSDDDCDTRIDESADAACGERRECRDARCECAAPYMNCGGFCEDVSTSTVNCGACGASCRGGACNAGVCTCPVGQTLCPGAGCVDVGASATHCGSCGRACAWNEGCRAGTCASCYAAGGPCCDGTSVGSDDFCGPAESLTCVGDTCEPCGGAGQACCFYSATGEYCPVSVDLSCVDHVCSCPVGQMACDGTCIDTTYDPMHCGSCTRACTASQSCISGACVTCGVEGAICCGTDPSCGSGLLCVDRCRRAATCDVFAQTGCRAGEACYASYYGTYCAPAGSGVRGAVCTADGDCAPGSGCTDVLRDRLCRPYCDTVDGVPGCLSGERCGTTGVGSIGICR